MFPPVVAVRLRQNEDEHRAPVGLRRVSVSRPAPSRRSPEPSECVVALEVNATQLQGARVSQTMPATSCDEQRYPQGSSPPTSHHASTVRQPHETQTDSLHSIQRLPASTVNSYFIDEDSTLPTNFKEWRRQQVTMTTSFDGPEMIDSGIGHITAYPVERSYGGSRSRPANVINAGHSRSQPEMNADKENRRGRSDVSASELPTTELAAVGKLGLSPRMKVKGSPPPRSVPGSIRSRVDAKSVERLPPLTECRPARIQHLQQQQTMRTVTVGDVELRPSQPISSSTPTQLAPLQLLSVSGRSPRNAVETNNSLVLAEKRDEFTLAVAGVGTLKRDERPHADNSSLTGLISVSGRTPQEATKISSTAAREDSANDVTMTDLSLRSNASFNDGDDCDEQNAPDDDEDDADNRMPILSVRIQITGSDQRRTVVATSDVSSTGCDVIEKRPPIENAAVRLATDDVDRGKPASSTGGLVVGGERYLSIAGRGKFIVVDDSSYENFARRRPQPLPRFSGQPGSQSTAVGNGIGANGKTTAVQQQNVARRVVSK